MHTELEKLIRNERKNKRELLELRALRAKTAQHKNPDPKVLKMIDEEIVKLTGEKS